MSLKGQTITKAFNRYRVYATGHAENKVTIRLKSRGTALNLNQLTLEEVNDLQEFLVEVQEKMSE